MSSANWWARKFGSPAPAPTAPVYSSPPAQPVHPSLAPFPVAPGAPARVTAENLTEAAALWKGGAGTRTETSHCPNCGSPNYFSRSNQGFENPNHTGAGATITTERGSASVAARCFGCGYTTAASHASLQ